MSAGVAQARPTRRGAPGRQLLLGLVCMMCISSPQYVWTLFARPFAQQIGAGAAAIQVTFSLLVVLQTVCAPLQGLLLARLGPRLLIASGEALTGLAWLGAARAHSLVWLYLSYGVLGGLGTGIVYVGVIGLLVGWFPRRRGLAAGLAASGYGLGAMLTTLPISLAITRFGMRPTLAGFGLLLALLGALAASFLRAPPAEAPAAGPAAGPAANRASAGVPPGAMLRTGLFWLMFAMMAMMSTSGLMVTSQLAALAADHGLAGARLLGLGVLPLALTLDRLTNGLTRPVFGLLSDRIGREPTMALAFGLEGLAMAGWASSLAAHDPLGFVLLSGVVFFGWGEIFSLFPATLTDSFGSRHATVNYGLLYLSQGVGSILGGPLASALHQATGGWRDVFALAIGADLLTACLALLVLRPVRRRWATSARPADRP